MSTIPVGAVRPSQLLWTYGPGALIDLPNLSVVTMGLDYWNTELCTEIREARLLTAVRQTLGQQVERLLKPPVVEDEETNAFAPEMRQGVPVRPFPRWLRCVRCGLLAEYDLGLFEIKEDKYRPERTRFVHKGCVHGAKSDAVPARFLLACSHGHLDDFPWHWFVHGGPSQCKGTLRFYESGASLQTENLWVKCDSCGSSKQLARAFGAEGKQNLPGCRGRHPHLGTYETCNEQPCPVILGATNSWFPVTLSLLAIPPLESSPITQLVENGWGDFREVESPEELRGTIRALIRSAALPGLDQHSPEAIWNQILAKRGESGENADVSEGDIKLPEWRVLTSESQRDDFPHYLSEPVAAPAKYNQMIRRVSLLKRLREVNALLGFTRVESPEESGESEQGVKRASLTKMRPTWVPATEVYGEGVFIQFDETAVRKWENMSAVQIRQLMLLSGHKGWRTSRKLEPAEDNYPGIRYAMLHTLSHLLVREFALECGYGAASIRERIYASDDSEAPMAGILLYTAAADSDGTLGGLVELGKPENLGRILELALERATVCSSDPLCSEHDPKDDRSLHAAACHACSFVAETSCERGNRYLDRALLVPTFDCDDAGFFVGQTML